MSENVFDCEKTVDRGIKLSRIIEKSTKELDTIKVTLRSAAKHLLEIEPDLKNPVPFLGKKGSATVTFKSDSLKAKGAKELIALKNSLPPSTFYNLFDEEVVIKPCSTFKKKLEKLPDDQKKMIMEAFNNVPNTPSVEFSK